MGEQGREGPGLAPGTIVGDKYAVVRRMGEGGMGAVYEAVQRDLGRRVAVKTLHAHLSQNATAVARFRREAEAAAALGHPNIVQVTDFGFRAEHGAFLVMEYLQGESLASAVQREGALDPPRVAFIARQILAALEVAHAAGIVHRDLKPDNVFLTEIAGVRDVVKLLDFGIAKLNDGDDAGAPRLTSTGAVLGTPAYMAPEQARGRAVDHRADLYAVGVLMYEALSGRVPFAAENYNALLFSIMEDTPRPLASLRAGLPAALVAVVDRAMARAPAERFQTAGELRAALEPFAPGGALAVSLPSYGPGASVPAGDVRTLHAGFGTDATVAAGAAPVPSTRMPLAPTQHTQGTLEANPSRSVEANPGARSNGWRTPVAAVVGGALVLVAVEGASVFRRPPAPPAARAASSEPARSIAAGAPTGMYAPTQERALPAPSASIAPRVTQDLPPPGVAPGISPPATPTVTGTAVRDLAVVERARPPRALTIAPSAPSPARAPSRRYSVRISGGILGTYRTDGVREALAPRMGAIVACTNSAGETEPEWYMDFRLGLDGQGHVTSVAPHGDTTVARTALTACMRRALTGATVGDPSSTDEMVLSFSMR